jgi:hypothetical protein
MYSLEQVEPMGVVRRCLTERKWHCRHLSQEVVYSLEQLKTVGSVCH